MNKKTKIYIASFVIITPLIFVCVLLSKNVDIIWSTDDETRYEKCEKFGKKYPCNTTGFTVPLGIGGCSRAGL